MKVFVWSGYGDISVYRIDTLANIQNLWSDFEDTIKYFDDEDFNIELEKANKHIAKFIDSDEDSRIKSYIAAINHMLNNGIRDSNIDSIERISGFVEMKEAK